MMAFKDLDNFKLVEPKDFVISLRSFEGGFEYSEYKGIISPAYTVFRLIRENNYEKFWKYLFKSTAFLSVISIISTGIRDGLTVKFENFKKISVPVPSFPEQKAIAKYLDKKTEIINKLIVKQKKLIELLKEKRSAIITESVTKGFNPNAKLKPSRVDWIGDIPEGWDLRKIKHTTYVKGRIGWQNLRSEEFSTVGILCITGTDFKNGVIDIENAYRVSYERYEQDPFIQLKENDLLITKDGTIGKTALIKGLKEKATLNSGIFVTRPKRNEYIQEFMFWLLHSRIFAGFIEIISKGTTINHLYQYIFQGFSYPLPSIIEQKNISVFIETKIETIDKLIDKATQVIKMLGEYKESLITEAVTGKICVYSEENYESSKTDIVEVNQKKENKAFKRNVLAAEIIHQLYKEPTFGHVKFEKIMFLCEKSIEADFSDYKRAAAGPYDSKAIRGIDAQLKKLKWFEAKKEDKRIVYKLLEKAGDHKKYYNGYFSKNKETIECIVNLFRKTRTEECEIIATLYSAWLDFLQSNKIPSDKSIVDEVLNNWHESKKRITRDRWENALKWMKEKDLIPKK